MTKYIQWDYVLRDSSPIIMERTLMETRKLVEQGDIKLLKLIWLK